MTPLQTSSDFGSYQHAFGSNGGGSPAASQQQQEEALAALGAILEDNYAILNTFKTNMQQCKV